jgi:structural maintenance of chromosome 4
VLTSSLCLRSQSEPDAADVKRASQLEKTIASLEGDLEALRTKASKFSDAIAALEDKIREVGGIKFRTAEAKVSDLQDQIRLTDGRLVKAKTEKAKAEKDLVKLSKAIETNTAKSDELEAEIGELKEQLAEKEAEAEPVRRTVEEAQAKVEEGREELANLKSELEEQEEAIIEFRKAEVRLLPLLFIFFPFFELTLLSSQAHLKGIFSDLDRKLKETTRIFEHWAAKIGELQMPEFDLSVLPSSSFSTPSALY